MNYQVEITDDAKRDLRALPAYVRVQAIQAIESLAVRPRPERAKELRGKPNIYRLWIAGKWRLAYEIEEERRMIVILRIRLKESIDYENL